MDERAVEIIAEHELKTNEKLIKEFESLKPKPFRGLISLVVLLGGLYVFEYATNTSFFENGGYFFFLAVIISSGAVETESNKINKRIDTLVKLIKSGAIKADD